MDNWKIEQEYESIIDHRCSNQNPNSEHRPPPDSGSFWQGLAIASWLALLSWTILYSFIIVYYM